MHILRFLGELCSELAISTATACSCNKTDVYMKNFLTESQLHTVNWFINYLSSWEKSFFFFQFSNSLLDEFLLNLMPAAFFKKVVTGT